MFAALLNLEHKTPMLNLAIRRKIGYKVRYLNNEIWIVNNYANTLKACSLIALLLVKLIWYGKLIGFFGLLLDMKIKLEKRYSYFNSVLKNVTK